MRKRKYFFEHFIGRINLLEESTETLSEETFSKRIPLNFTIMAVNEAL